MFHGLGWDCSRYSVPKTSKAPAQREPQRKESATGEAKKINNKKMKGNYVTTKRNRKKTG